MTDPTEKKILILEEKHGDRYYDASTPEALSRAAVKVLKERAEEGYWYIRHYADDTPANSKDAELLAVTDEDLAATPAVIRADLEAQVLKARQRVERTKRLKLEEDEWFDALESVISAPEEEAWQIKDKGQFTRGGTYLAYALLRSRSDYEYEGIRIETLR